jgi:beta-phosphoglucomutase
LPGVLEFLTELKHAGILLGLSSASKNARTILERIELVSGFDVIVDGNLITQAKPHPEVFALGAELLRTDAANCIVFEDAIAGIQAAHSAGMKCVGVGSADTLKEADLVIPGFKNLKLADIIL